MGGEVATYGWPDASSAASKRAFRAQGRAAAPKPCPGSARMSTERARPSAPSDAEIWDTLQSRVAGTTLHEGPIFQRDVLLGYRHVFNDEESTTLQLGVIVDLEDPSELMIIARFERRLAEVWSIQANLRAVLAEPEGPSPLIAELDAVGLERWNGANELNLTLTRFF